MWPFFRMMHKRRGLRGWIIAILARSPKNGAEITDTIEEMSQGWWRPSPGSIYPLLEDLQKEGLIQKREDRRYELTPKSREEADWFPGFGGARFRAHGVEEMLRDMDGYASYLEDLGKSDKSRLEPHRDGIRKVAQRLLRLAEGGETTT